MADYDDIRRRFPHLDDENDELEEHHSWDHLNRWQTLVDERIRALIGDGDMSWHPGAGQPLALDTDRTVPDDQRIAYKIMKDNDAVPVWMALGFTLRDKHEKILRRIQQYARDYVQRRDNALRKGSFVLHNHAEDRWKDAIKRLREDIARYNSELLDYNLQVPSQIGQMIPLDADDLIEQALRAANGD